MQPRLAIRILPLQPQRIIHPILVQMGDATPGCVEGGPHHLSALVDQPGRGAVGVVEVEQRAGRDGGSGGGGAEERQRLEALGAVHELPRTAFDHVQRTAGLLARLLTGVGLGAALPNLIALTSEAAGPRFRGRAVSLMYCGVPIGAALAAALGFSGLAAAWQTIFWIGGVVPLLLIPLLMRWLPESQAFQRAEASVPLRTLFAPGQAAATLLLWLGYFFTLLVVYMLINWLPMLLVGQGFRASQAAGVMFSLQIGAACGTLLLGALMDKLSPLWMSLLIYIGMLASLLALGTATSLTTMLFSGFVAGLFATGGQSVLYALAPLFYRTEIRATGVGTAVAIGRLGAMSGPLLAGKMLALGTGTVGVMAASAPGILLAGVAVFWLMNRQKRAALA